MIIYLAGPIFECTDTEAHEWRKGLVDVLETYGHEVIDPTVYDCRGKELEQARMLVEWDKAQIAACDVVLANCWRPSFGTAMEIHLAHSLQKRVVVVTETKSPWLEVHAECVPTMGQALKLLGIP